MVFYRSQEALEGCTIVKIFTGMNFVTHINASFIEGVEDWQPARRQFAETCIDQSGATICAGIQTAPYQSPGKGGVLIQTKIFTRLACQHHLINRSLLPLNRIAVYRGRCKTIKHLIMAWTHCNQLPPQMCGQLRDHEV